MSLAGQGTARAVLQCKNFPAKFLNKNFVFLYKYYAREQANVFTQDD